MKEVSINVYRLKMSFLTMNYSIDITEVTGDLIGKK